MGPLAEQKLGPGNWCMLFTALNDSFRELQ